MYRNIIVIIFCVFLTISALPAIGVKVAKINTEVTIWNYNDPSSIDKKALDQGRLMVKLIEQLNEKMIKSYIENLTAFGPRVTGTPSCDQAAHYIYNEFKDMRLTVRFQNWTSGGLHGSNIEATLNGVDNSNNAIYIICGHYDGVPESLAADDNGAGTATVMAAANVMSQYTFEHTVRFVLFSGEEQGLFGSYAYSKEAHSNKDNIRAAFNIDMTGYSVSSNEVEVWENIRSHWITKRTVEINQRYQEFIGLEVVFNRVYAALSDHFSFWQFGYESIFYYEAETNPYFHTPKDTIGNMNITYATKVSKLIMATLADFAIVSFSLGGVTWYVGGSGDGNYSKIQDAIDNASIGDTVYVYNGTYHENIIINKPLDLIGENKDCTVIAGYLQENVVLISSSWVYVSDFTIQNNGSIWNSAGIYVCSNNNMIIDNNIVNNLGYGIGLWRSSYNNISKNDIMGNKDGLFLWASSSYNLISENFIENNEVCGICLASASNYNRILSNAIINNSFGIYTQPGVSDSGWNPQYNLISGNEITDNNYGIYLNVYAKENRIIGNNIIQNTVGIFLGYNSNKNKINKNNFIGNNHHAFFDSCFRNRWIRNYWDDRIRLRPKIIVGRISPPWTPSLKWVNVDLLPARQPYKID